MATDQTSSADDVLIRMQDVHKAFDGQQVLNGLSFEVRRGRCLGLMGGSGTGKSVSLQHLIGLLQPDQGRVVVDGQDLATIDHRQLADLRRRMGYVFQEGALINWLTVAENLALPLQENTDLGPSEIADRVHDKLALVHIPDAGDKFPSQISGGMKKRVGLARALITDPEIILYDEPNAGLDPQISRSINLLIREPNAGLDPQISRSINLLIRELSDKLRVTSVVVEHRIDCLKTVADEIVFMYGGRALVRARTDQFFQPTEPKLQEFLGL